MNSHNKGTIYIGEGGGCWHASLVIHEPLCRTSKCGTRPRTLCRSEGSTRAEALRNMADSLELLDNRLKEKAR